MKKNYNKRTESDYGFFRQVWYQVFTWLAIFPVAKLLYNLRVEGKENLPNSSNVIFACNHVSYLDPPFVKYATGKFIAYMAKKELFEDKNKLLSFLVHSLGAFAVNREKPELATFKSVKAVFNTKKWALGIFPQGRIENEHVIQNVTKGFVLFSKKFNADVVPVAMCGFDGYAHKLFEKNVTVKIGKSISHELPEDKIAQEWVTQICDMTGYKNKTGD